MTPNPTPLVQALSAAPAGTRDALVREAYKILREDRCQPDLFPIWHALANLAADVSAQERATLDELELALDDFTVGGIVDLDSLDTPNEA